MKASRKQDRGQCRAVASSESHARLHFERKASPRPPAPSSSSEAGREHGGRRVERPCQRARYRGPPGIPRACRRRGVRAAAFRWVTPSRTLPPAQVVEFLELLGRRLGSGHGRAWRRRGSMSAWLCSGPRLAEPARSRRDPCLQRPKHAPQQGPQTPPPRRRGRAGQVVLLLRRRRAPRRPEVVTL